MDSMNGASSAFPQPPSAPPPTPAYTTPSGKWTITVPYQSGPEAIFSHYTKGNPTVGDLLLALIVVIVLVLAVLYALAVVGYIFGVGYSGFAATGKYRATAEMQALQLLNGQR